jgi:hypothetical protein
VESGSGNSEKETEVSVTNEQVYQKDGSLYGGNGIVKMVYGSRDEDAPDEYEEVGSIANGKLSFRLPAAVPEKYLSPLDPDTIPGITVSPSDVKMFTTVWRGNVPR